MSKWYIQQDNRSLGPFTLEEMIQKKQNKELFEHDYVWADHVPGWVRVYFVSELKLSSETPGINRRKNKRYKVNLECILSNNTYSYLGKILSLSQGGALIEISNPHLQIGQNTVVLIKPSSVNEFGFIKRGKIANKQFIPHKVQFKSRCQYVVVFDKEDPSVVKNLSDAEEAVKMKVA
ncbi:MAG: GYF domain-containing protein [Bdellovibrionaceae bacterium]|nr:GYF domain-containing protein [Pseudobdellovibrionaceae bacterium]MDW8189796.1 GYF domain-containing protein [Pseudobdellovibrionaceae bacterium]